MATTLFTLKILPNFNKENFLDLITLKNNFKNRVICSISKYEKLNQKRETIYNKNDFINEFDAELIWANSYYLHKVDAKGKRVYVYHSQENSL